MKLRKLPDSLVNRIAAGEVVERPASATKELVENALDAEAKHIDIIIRDGGKTLISVLDDGFGMTADELPLAIERHATSKLPFDDLQDITSFGFRGEALPAIAAVSRMKITSRTHIDSNAWSIMITAGKILDVMPASHTKGTRVEISDLFFATPARLKFLKTERTERNRIQEIVNRLAMANPSVNFSLSENGRDIISLKAKTSDLLDARLSRLGDIMGQDFQNNSIPIDAEREGYRMTGYASLPTLNRRNSAMQFLFVNGRPVRDKLLLGAVRGAYREFLAQNRYPMIVLFLDANPNTIDENVHPAKTEVRFKDDGIVRGLIVGGLRHALSEAGHRASTTVADAALGAARLSLGQSQLLVHTNPSTNFKTPIAPDNHSFATHLPGLDAPLRGPEISSKNTLDENIQNYPLGVARAQLHSTYVVSQTSDGIVIVDQHAAHERLVQEQIKKAMSKDGVMRQGLLIPEIVELKDNARSCLLSRKDELLAFGLSIEAFGDGAIIVRETPALLGEVNVSRLINDLADDLLELGDSISLEERLGDVCATMACHSSVRAGRSLKAEEMNALLREMENTPHSGQCSHGRPTYIELKLADIEHLFGRR